MHAPPKTDAHQVLSDPSTLTEYDAFLLGIPTRYGNFPAQWKVRLRPHPRRRGPPAARLIRQQIFWDKTGGLWAQGKLSGKYAGLFVCTSGLGGGQESTVISAMSTLAHHGIIYVPLGYAEAGQLLSDLTEVHGGSPWGAGSLAVSPSLFPSTRGFS